MAVSPHRNIQLFDALQGLRHADVLQPSGHGDAHDEGKDEGENHCQSVAESGDPSIEGNQIYVNPADDESQKNPTQSQAQQGTDSREKNVLPEDVGGGFAFSEAQHLDGGNLPDSLGDVDVGQVVQHDKGERSRRHD